MNKALIVIDAQKYFLNERTGSTVRKVVKRIRKYVIENQKDFPLIFFTIFKNDQNSPVWKISDWKEMAKSPDTDICDELKEFVTKDNLIYKNILSAVKINKIKQALIKNNISEVYLCGFDTDCCVLATAYDLYDQGIKPVILENLCWSTAKDNLHKPTLKIINSNIGFIEKV
jgi:nicotinamidase-related amidase